MEKDWGTLMLTDLSLSLCMCVRYALELHGIDRTVLLRALKILEHKGKLTIFKGTSADDEGVKFSI